MEMIYLQRAIKDGYAFLSGEDKTGKITYVTSDNFSVKFDNPEEKDRSEFWAELIYKYDYPANRIKLEVAIPDRLPTDRADIVIFRDDECKRPYIIVECKKDGVTDAEFTYGTKRTSIIRKVHQTTTNIGTISLRKIFLALR